MPRAETRFFWYPAKADPGSGHWVMSCLQECGNDLVDLPPSVAVAGNLDRPVRLLAVAHAREAGRLDRRVLLPAGPASA